MAERAMEAEAAAFEQAFGAPLADAPCPMQHPVLRGISARIPAEEAAPLAQSCSSMYCCSASACLFLGLRGRS